MAQILANTIGMEHNDWLEHRRNGLGGSDSAAIVGLNPYMSPFDVYADKLGLSPEKDDSEAMRQGRDLEEYVAQRFVEHTGKRVRRRNAIFFNQEYPWMLANIDRQIVGEEAGLECKTTSVLNRADFKNGEYPPNYYVQCMHYMAVTGFKKWYLAVLVLNKGFHVFEIERDEGEIQALVEAEKYFWEEHVVKQVPPPPDGSERTTEVLKSLYSSAREMSQVDLMGMESTVKELVGLNKQIKGLEKQAEALKQKLQIEMAENELGLLSGYQIKWTNQSRNSIDSKLLKAEYPSIYEKVLKQTNFRKFEIKELKVR